MAIFVTILAYITKVVKTVDHPSLKIQQNNLSRASYTLIYPQVKVQNFAILALISSMFVENVSQMYINMSYKFHRIPDIFYTVSFIKQVHDLLGQPSYMVKGWESERFLRCKDLKNLGRKEKKWKKKRTKNNNVNI